MPDVDALLETLEGFAETLAAGCGISDMLHTMVDQIATVLGVTGAGVILVQHGRFTYATSPVEAIAELERVVEAMQAGPCVDAANQRRPVLVDDLTEHDYAQRWPEYTAQAAASRLRAVAALPLSAGDQTLGALGLYERQPRSWRADDLRAARILAKMASSHLVNASELEQQRRVSEQLKRALDTRIVVEQAKGILAAERGISVDEAFAQLRKHARDHNALLHDVAAAVVHLHMRP